MSKPKLSSLSLTPAGFDKAHRLAHVLDSLVRVSRRVGRNAVVNSPYAVAYLHKGQQGDTNQRPEQCGFQRLPLGEKQMKEDERIIFPASTCPARPPQALARQKPRQMRAKSSRTGSPGDGQAKSNGFHTGGSLDDNPRAPCQRTSPQALRPRPNRSRRPTRTEMHR